MQALRHSTRWLRIWRRRGSAAADRSDDAADMGTAFGLDLSLSAMEEDALRASAALAAPGEIGWARRLVQRRRRAAV